MVRMNANLKPIQRFQVDVHADLPSLWTENPARHEIFGVCLGYEPQIQRETKNLALAQRETFGAMLALALLYGRCWREPERETRI